jgi:hypothetical protein
MVNLHLFFFGKGVRKKAAATFKKADAEADGAEGESSVKKTQRSPPRSPPLLRRPLYLGRVFWSRLRMGTVSYGECAR